MKSLVPAMMAGVLAAFTLVAPRAAAEPEWVSFDGSEPGTEALVLVDPDLSDQNQTVIRVKIPGAWVEGRDGADGEVYQQVSVPGLPSLNTPGVPELPVVRLRLAVASDASRVTFGAREIMAQDALFLRVWPHPIPEMDGGEDGGTPEVFVLNDEIYFGEGLYPPDPVMPIPDISAVMGVIRGTECELSVCQWNPRSDELVIATDVVYVLRHDGAIAAEGDITRDRYRAAAHVFDNWPAVADIIQWNPVLYEADYLIVHPEGYLDELQPFIAHLRTRGYRVTTTSTELTGPSCDSIRSAITEWYYNSPTYWDQYCLLVGDVEEIPLCDSPPTSQNGLIVRTDDLYGSVNGDDLFEEVFVGRLSINDEADLTNQLQKIIEYTNGSVSGWNRNRVALVAHKEGAPGKYQGSHEVVRTNSYVNPPQFTTFYGASSATDGAVSAAINDGLGLVAYRGHGNTVAWTTWNGSGESYGQGDVNGLTNGERTPVVWSFSCTNANLNASDCIAETWMAKADGGAVAHYGATRTSYTTPNHKLNEALFEVTYDWQMPTQAYNIAVAENVMTFFTYEDNAWMYLLNGDPSMPIRDEDESLIPFLPEYIELCEIPCDWPFSVFDPLGNPVEGAIVSVWKAFEGGVGTGDDVFTNRYSDASGEAVLTMQPQTTGFLHYSIRDDQGRVATGMIPVVDDPVDVPGAADAAIAFRAMPSVMQTHTAFQFGVPLPSAGRVRVHDAAGRLVTELAVQPGQAAVAWDGRDGSGARVGSGVYFARLEGTERSHSTRLVVVR